MRMRYRKMYFAVASAVSLPTISTEVWSGSASMRSQVSARFDIGRGRYELLLYGLPTGSRPEFQRLLRDRHGIKTETVAGCVVSETLQSYVDSYNAAIADAAKRRFGHDVVKESAETADRNWDTPRQESSAAAACLTAQLQFATRRVFRWTAGWTTDRLSLCDKPANGPVDAASQRPYAGMTPVSTPPWPQSTRI
jgi:hypothetical protein